MDMTEKLESYARFYAEVDLDAVRENMDRMKANLSPDGRMIGVIKADGYGHGSVPIAEVLEPLAYVYGFATASFEEARILRRAGIQKPLLILGHTFPYCYEEMIRLKIRPAVFYADALRLLARQAEKAGMPAYVHIKVDTGMSRIGIRPDEEGLAFVEWAAGLPEIRVEGIFTHFARADEADKTAAEEQLRQFKAFCGKIEERLGYPIPMRHCANSAAIIRMPEAEMDAVRAGIALYGLWPSNEVERDIVRLRPALSLFSRIVFIKEMRGGEGISYGGTAIAKKGMRVATIPVGYADGYPRSLSNKGWALIHGRRAPILGRICMDQMMVDVSEIPQASLGDRVTLLGRDGEACITAEELGELSGRFNYELVCDFSKRVPRVYKKGKKIAGVKDYYDDFEYIAEKGQ